MEKELQSANHQILSYNYLAPGRNPILIFMAVDTSNISLYPNWKKKGVSEKSEAMYMTN